MFKGLIIQESLENLNVLKNVSIVKEEEWNVSNSVEGQSPVWHISHFEVNPGDVKNISSQLSRSLKDGKWYINCDDGIDYYIIYKNKVFSYKKGDIAPKEEAKEYGRHIGIPESQLDF